jgi:DMSO/TMAO reductase YedYZ molybdopterin-dependent catalytic subunit
MIPKSRLNRRGFLLAASGTMLLSGCDRLTNTPWFMSMLDRAASLNQRVQRTLASRDALAPEYQQADLSAHFRSNGTHDPSDPAYRALAKNNFADWRLEVGGLVDRPGKFSLADLRAMPARTQITRHDCVEGWSCIGKWTGARLGPLLDHVGVKPEARYVAFHCADALPSDSLDQKPDKYYESIDFRDAYHPQTILAYDMNDAPLQVPYGAPLRLRVERQLGYKMAKYLMRMDLVDGLAGIGDGNGGYWEDRGYAWYAGI